MSIYRLDFQDISDYNYLFTPTTLSDSLQIHSFVHSAYTSKLTLTTSLCLLRLQLLVHSDLVILEPFFSITPVGRFWLVKTYQYGWYPSVLSHHAFGTAECDESYCIEGTIFGRSFVGVWGFFFTMSHTATRATSWPYMDFWTFKLCVTSVLVWGYAPIWEMGVSMALYGNAATPQFFRVHKTDHTLLQTCVSSK